MVITEKIDGSNAAIGIVELTETEYVEGAFPPALFAHYQDDDRFFGLYAQSRSRLITPGKSTDNYTFAQWVLEHADSLVRDLGVGLHFGEWWGSGINRGYGLPKGEKRFSLFNTSRYADQ